MKKDDTDPWADINIRGQTSVATFLLSLGLFRQVTAPASRVTLVFGANHEG